MKAYVDIRSGPHYRIEAFVAGLKVLGYHVLQQQLPASPPGPQDVLVLWNRYSDKELTADRWEAQGGTVLVAENGYCGRDTEGRQFYAIAKHGHNGSGTWPEGGPERWDALGLELKPWRAAGDHILVCPNRHFGMKGLAMPTDWEARVVRDLRTKTKRPIRVRPHPNNAPPVRPLAEDLVGAYAVVIWASSCGVHALLAGIPVICTSPWWICKAASFDGLKEGAPFPERRPVFERLAWAQWSVEEISRGDPFRHLLHHAGEGQVAAAV